MAADVSDDPRVSAAMRQIRDGVADLAAALTAIAAEHLARALRRRLPAGETDTATT
jgi:hypothetical protein